MLQEPLLLVQTLFIQDEKVESILCRRWKPGCSLSKMTRII